MPTPKDEQHAATMIEGVNSTADLLGIGGPPTYDGTEVLTDGQAQAARTVVDHWFAARGYVDRPALYPPGHEGPMWVLSLEACGEWSIDVSNNKALEWPAGVWVEPVASWCLGLYPTT